MFQDLWCHFCLTLVVCSDSVISQCLWICRSVSLDTKVSVLYLMSSLLMPEMLIISPQVYGLGLCTIDFHPFLLVQTSRSSGYYCVQSQFSSELTELLLTRYHQQTITALLLLVTVFNETDPQNESLRKFPGNPEVCSPVSLRRQQLVSAAICLDLFRCCWLFCGSAW